jgi:predicted nuclease of predicted toxin-antitoxin system
MRILCDQNVPEKYLTAFQSTPDITARPVEDVLSHDAEDSAIASYAETNGWVVFTGDEDFFTTGGNYGLLVYDQIENPTPGAVVTAVRRIHRFYESDTEIMETVPGDWE